MLLARSGDVYRWAATGEANESLRQRHLKVAREVRAPQTWLRQSRPYHLHYVNADRLVAEQIQRVLSRPPIQTDNRGVVRRFFDRLSGFPGALLTANPLPQQEPEALQQSAPVTHIAILSNKSTVAWAKSLASKYEPLVLVAASSIVIPHDVPALYRFQWVAEAVRRQAAIARVGLVECAPSARLWHGRSS